MANVPTEYRGYKVEKIVATQVGHPLPNSRNLRQQLGHGTSRKQSGVQITQPDGYQRFFDTWAKAKKWIDDYEGPDAKALHKSIEDTARRVKEL